MPELLPSNQLAWIIWTLCNRLRQPIGADGGLRPTIDLQSFVCACELYDADLQELYKVVLIEETLIHKIREADIAARKAARQREG